MKQSKRYEKIIELVQQNSYVNTDDLVILFNVSPQTIRRDLNELADLNKIRRTYGGATLPSSSENSSYSSRKVLQLNAKSRIADELVKHIPNGSTLFIDIGTTPEFVATSLVKEHKDLRIVTNNINAASILISRTDFKVILAGGEIRNKDGGIIGEETQKFISQFRLDFGIIGISGIDLSGSLLDFDHHEVQLKQEIIKNSRKVFLAVDHTKFGREAMVFLCDLKELDLLVTDQAPPKELVQILSQNDIPYKVV